MFQIENKKTDIASTETEELYKTVRSILNKMTPKTFRRLVNKTNSLLIDTEERLKGVIDLVYEKAIDEPITSVCMANLCKCLAMMKVPLSNKSNNDYVNFRKILLNKCQKEFEKDINDEVDREKWLKERNVSESEERKKELIEELVKKECTEQRAKKRSLGNIRFIGELFKLHMLTANIMHDCIKKFLSQEDEHSLECLCQLLIIIGKHMEAEKREKEVNKMNIYYQQMQEIVEKKQISSRLRFMLQNVIELRTNNWVPRRDRNNPKSLHQIHLEVNQEADKKEALLQQQSSHHSLGARSKTKVVSEVSKGQLMDAEDISDEEMERKTKLIICKVKGKLMDVKDMPAEEMMRKTKLITDKAKGKLMGAKDISDEEMEEKIKLIIEEVSKRKLMGAKEISDKEMERKTKLIIDEFLRNNDFKETAYQIYLLCSNSTIQAFVMNAFDLVMERSSQARLLVGQLVNFLIEEKVITTEQYIKWFALISCTAKEHPVDIPHFWEYLAELIAPILQDGNLPLKCLREIAQPCVNVNLAGKLVSEVLHVLVRNLGTQKVTKMWKQSGLSWSDFLSENQNQEQFIAENRLEFTIVKSESPLSFEEIEQELNFICHEKKADNEEVFDWIDNHVSEEQTKEPAFVRTLITAIVKGVLEGAGTDWNLQQNNLRKRCTVLQKYLEHKDELELQALYALQSLMHQMEHPKGVLCSIFDTLYDEDIISEDVLVHWESSDDPAEQEGKSVALQSVQTFFRWLREMDNESIEDS